MPPVPTPKADRAEGTITNKVPVQRPGAPDVPASPPLALPGPSVGAGRIDARASLGARPHAVAEAFTKELSVWPEEEDFTPEEEPPRRPSSGVAGSTHKSLVTLDPPRSDVETRPSTPAVPAGTEREVEEEPSGSVRSRPGHPRMELRVPTGWVRTVTSGDIKRRKAKATPEAKVQPPTEDPRKGLSRTQFVAIMTIIGLLNAPLFLVAGEWVRGLIVEETVPGELSIEEIVQLELALEARPGAGDELLEEQGLDRQSWSALRSAITADPSRSAQFTAIRARLEQE